MDLATKVQRLHALKLKRKQLEEELEVGKKEVAELEERYEEQNVEGSLRSRAKKRVSPLVCLPPVLA
jgi:hypothetical protein